MADISEICRFNWHVDNPFLPLEKKEAIFYFGSPRLTKWKATIQPELGDPMNIGWPVTFTLQDLSRDSNKKEKKEEKEEKEEEKEEKEEKKEEKEEEKEEKEEEKGEKKKVPFDVTVDIANVTTRPAPVVFDGKDSYSCKSFIGPEHGKLDIEVEIVIQDQGKKEWDLKRDLEPLLYLSGDLKRLLSDHLYFDMRLQSRDGGARFPVHSYILNVRGSNLLGGITVQPNPDDPPTNETPLPSDVLDYILTYLYTGINKHLHSATRDFEKYKFDLMLTLEEHPLHPICMMLKAEPNMQKWETRTHITSSAVTFRLEQGGELGLYAWTHNPLPDVSVTTFLKFTLTSNNPSFSYSLRFTNPIKLFARVNLEYRRKVAGLGVAKGTVMYHSDHEIPCNGMHVPVQDIRLKGNLAHLKEFIDGVDRVENGYEVEHSFRFILHLSNGENCIKVSKMKFFDPKLASLRILSKQMSTVLEQKIGADLQAVGEEENSETRLLHKGIFAVRVQEWRNAIENPPADNNIPDVVRCKVSSVALPFIIQYIYTATCSPTEEPLDLKISDFAILGGISFLHTDIYAIGYQRLAAKGGIQPLVNV